MKEKYLSWGASFGIHFCILAAAAAMGLFSIATESEKRPIDVVIYDASAPESAPAPAAEAAPPMPSIDDIPIEPPKKEQQETQEQPKDTPKTAATNTSAVPSTSQGTSEQPSAASSTGSGESSGRDAAAAQRPSVPPKLLSGAAPAYPKELERKGITGTVGLAIVVGANGGVQSVDVTSSSGHAELDQAAITAAYTYSFEPARNIYDEPVACRVNRSFSFS
ncbi:energy transducer TonB [uncultured Selenomonas sp.]|uniref:energy transducer TonB n=1 Tax=uncultured Selenomonas sp. TaxID=159275 RepID=UPI0028E8F1C9|nr:energy transducer TonB [uncultured Selenomonas sp.]